MTLQGRTSKVLRIFSIISSISLVLSLALTEANAVQGGSDALGDKRVVAFVFGTNTRASCSGVPINPYVVVAAAHCLSNPNVVYSSETYKPSGLSVSQPGVDLTKDSIAQRPHVNLVALTPGYSEKSFADDLAFYFLDAPLVGIADISIGNLEDLKTVKEKALPVTHVGYGYILPGNIEDFKPHKITLPASPYGSIRLGYFAPSEGVTISTDEVKGQALCKHDSGGPFLATVGGIEKLIAINLAADGCDRNGAGSEVKGTLGLSIFPYLDLLERNWNSYLSSNGGLAGISDANQALQLALKSARQVKTPEPTPSPAATASSAPIASPAPVVTPTSAPANTLKCKKGAAIKIIKTTTGKCPSGYKLTK